MERQFCNCLCFLNSNIFLKAYNAHITFWNREQFLANYSQVLRERGCPNPEGLIPEIKQEIERRKKFEEESYGRKQLISSQYKRLHPHIFKLQILLDELGFDEEFLTPFRTKYLQPITRILYPDWGGDCLDSQKAFVVKYSMGEDTDLDYHYDNAEITLNVSMSENFEAGELYFGDMKCSDTEEKFGYEHQYGRGLLHRGQHKHGALPIESGVRYNLIIWMRSSQIRNVLCPMCDSEPELIPVQHGYGAGFTKTTNVCATS